MRGERERAKYVKKMRNVKKRKEVIVERWKKGRSGKDDVERHGNGKDRKGALGCRCRSLISLHYPFVCHKMWNFLVPDFFVH